MSNLRAELAAAGSFGTNRPERDHDSFQSCFGFGVPDNPSHVVLNFLTVAQLERNSTSPRSIETELKAAVLQRDGSQSIAAVGSDIARNVGVEGMSGVGKSCALRGLVKDADVLERFVDGIYYISLGMDASDADVVRQVAKIVEVSGGSRMAGKVRAEESVITAVAIAKPRFAEKRVLLLVDDVWERCGCGGGVIPCLTRIADVSSGSRIVFTTREKRMAVGCKLVSFSPRKDDDSLQILLKAAGSKEADIGQFRDDVQGVLKFCAGSPMALAVAGSSIAAQRIIAPDCTMATIWREYLSKLKNTRAELIRRKAVHDTYDDLFSTFETSLSMLEGSVLGAAASERYRGLMILRRQGIVPVTVLARVWGISRDEALQMIDAFVNANMAQRVDREMNGETTPGITLHDLQLDFVQERCTSLKETEKWHLALLRSYVTEGSGRSPGFSMSKNWRRATLRFRLLNKETDANQSFFGRRERWGEDLFSDEYMRNNVSRHLLSAGLPIELYKLLTNPKWAAERLRAHEIVPLEEDFARMLKVLHEESGPDLQLRKDAESALKLIAGAARLSSLYLSQNPSEVWFQLYARLRPFTKQSKEVKRYAAEIERCAERPWLKSLSPCLPAPGGALQRTVQCGGQVMGIAEVDEHGNVIAYGEEGGKGFVSTVVNGQVEKTVAPEEAAVDRVECYGRSELYRVMLAPDNKRMAWRTWDGAIRVWDKDTGDVVLLCEQNGSVHCVAWSPDGELLACGSDDGVGLWDVETQQPLVAPLQGHGERVHCVAWSPDGKLFACGSDDGVRIWDVETQAALRAPMHRQVGFVNFVAWSPDGKLLACGSEEKVRLWDVETQEALGAPLQMFRVHCIAWSPNGKLLAYGSFKEVQLWDVETQEALGAPLRGHVGYVNCVAWSPDGKLVISGASDGRVCIWSAEEAAGAVRQSPSTSLRDRLAVKMALWLRWRRVVVPSQ